MTDLSRSRGRAGILMTGAVLALLVSDAAAARADTIIVTYDAPGVQTQTANIVANANKLGSETFDGLALGNNGFTTQYGTGGVITGVYSAGATISPADIYGGAEGTGHYVSAVNHSSGYSVRLTTSGVPGVNYFGYWLSALDAGNQATFYRDGVEIGTYVPAALVAAVGVCDGSNPYCGNPTAPYRTGDRAEPFAFINFVDTDGFFDEIRFTENPAVGGYESDNHTVAYCAQPGQCVTGNHIPEPVPLSLLGTGLVALGVSRRRKA